MKPTSEELNGGEGSQLDASLEGADSSSLDASMDTSADENSSIRQRPPVFRYNRTALTISALAVVLILVIALSAFGISSFLSHRNKSATNTGTTNSAQPSIDYSVGTLPVQGIQPGSKLEVGQADQLAINGQLKVNNTLVLTPTKTPTAPVPGQIYYDQTTKQPYYYNGSQFIGLAPTAVPQHVTSLGGAAGIVGIGQGLQVSGNQLEVSSSILQAVSNSGTTAGSNGTGVTSLQGQTGSVTLSAGAGVGVNGTSISNTGVLAINGTSGQIIVSGTTGNVTLSLPQSINATSDVQFNSLALGGGDLTLTSGAAVHTDSITSVDTGDDLTLSGDNNITFQNSGGANTFTFPTGGGPGQVICTSLNTCGSGGSVSANTALSNLSGVAINTSLLPGVAGTINLGSGTLPFGQLSLAGTSTTPGTNNFVVTGTSTGGTRTIALPDASGIVCLQNSASCGFALNGDVVSSLNGMTGVVAIANANGSAGTITINNAKADASTKGIATFNATNFSDNGTGTINTIQNIATSSTPSFGGLTLSGALSVTSGGASIAGGLNNNTGGITNTGSIGGVAGFTQSSGNFDDSASSGTFATGSGVVALNGNTAVAGTHTLSVGTGATTLGGTLGVTGLTTLSGGASITGGLNNNNGGISNAGSVGGVTTLSQSLSTNTNNAAATNLSVTNTNNTGTATTVNGDTIALLGTASGSNTINGIKFSSVTPIAGNTFNALNFGTGYDSLLTYNGTSLIDGSGLLQNSALSNSTTYTNITGVGTLTAGTWNGTAIAAQYGGTGLNTSASSGVPSINAGTWSVNAQLPATLGGTGIGSYAVGDLLYAATTTSLARLADVATGSCLISGGTSTAPSWGSCTGGAGGGVTSLDSQTGALSLANSTGAPGTITIDDASTTAKGIAKFNATNFSASAGSINTIQDIATTSAPTFGSLTVNGPLSITSGGASITGGLNNNNGGISNAGSVGGVTTLSQSLSTNTNNAAATNLSVTNTNNTGTATTVNGDTIALLGTASGSNTINGIKFSSVTPIAGNTFNALNFGTGYDSLLTYNGTSLIDGSGLLQNSALSNSTTYTNITGVGTLTAGTWNGTAIAAQYGGTGLNTSASSGVPSINAGTWSVNAQLPATLGGTGIGSYAVGDLLYAATTTSLARLADVATGSCLISGGTSTAPSWGSCTGGAGGGVTSLDSQTGALSLANSTGAPGTITIDDASTTAKGIAKFNATNFSASAGSINTIQDIATTSAPTFGSLTVNGPLSITSGGASITGGLNNNNGGISNAGSVGGVTTLSQSLSTNTNNAAATNLSVTNTNNTGTATTVNGDTIALLGTASGSNTINGIKFSSVTPIAGNTFNALNFGTGYDSLLTYNGTSLIDGSGLLQNSALSNSTTYTNITGVGTLTAGTWNGTAIAAQYGGTGLNTSASSGVPSINAGTWSVNAQLPATLGGTGIGSYAVGDLLYAATTTSLARLADVATGSCLISGGTSTAPSWGSCTGGAGGGVTSLDSQTGALSLANSTGAPGTITIDDASTTAKGIAKFNATNFSASAGSINTIQDIATTSAPTFGSLTVNGPLSITSGGASITGGLNNNNGGISNAGSVGGVTTLSQSLSTNTNNAAATNLSVTNTNNTGTATTVNGDTIALLGTASGSNTINGIKFSSVTPIAGNTFNALNFGTGYDSLLTYNGTSLIDGSGLLQNSALSNSTTYTNITGVGTLTAGTWNGTAIAAQYGGTGLNTSASSGVPSINAGTWSVNAQLPATLGGTGIGSYAVGDLLYAATTTSLARLADVATGSCLISGGTSTAPSWGSCTGGAGGGVTSLDSQTGALSLANSTGAPGTITIDDASTTAKGIAKFNATNFSASAGSINTIQDIATTSAPTFGSLTVNGPLSITSGGASITGGLNNNNGGISNAGSISDVTGFTQTSGNFDASATSGTFATGTGAVTLNGDTTVAGIHTLSVGTGATTLGGALGVTGLTTLSGGATVTGTININTTGSANTNINTGSSTGNVAIGNSGGNFTVTSAGLNVTAAGAVSGVTTLGLSGAITGATSGNTINGLIINAGALSGITTLATSSTINGATIASTGINGSTITSTSFNGATINSTSFNTATISGGTLTTSAVDGLGVSGTSVTGTSTLSVASTGANALTLDTGGASTVNLGNTNATTIQIGHTTGTVPTVNIQGNSVSIASSNGTNSTTVGFSGSQAAGNIIYDFDRTIAPGIYTVCTTAGNCAGTGGGITGTGTPGDIVKFNTSGSVTNSSLSESGSTVTASGNVVIQGAGSLSLGMASSADGSVAFSDAHGTHTVSLQAPSTDPASDLTFILPSSYGGSGDCLQSDGAGGLTFTSCTGGSGGGVTSLDSQTGVLSLGNSTGSAGTITINDAKADASTKGIATFNATNFTATTGTINTIQNIATSSTPSFGGLTLSGALSVTSGGASIAGGLNNNSGGITNAGSIAGATTLAQTVTTNTTNSAATSLNVTNSNATATSTTVNGETIALAGHASGTNITNGINFANVTTIGGNVFNGLNFGTGYDAVLNVGGNAIINGTGIIQSAGITGTYGNLTGTGTLTAGVWNATAIGAQYGGTGLNTSASTGVPSISGGTWSVNTQLPASLGGTGIGSYAVGDLLYASGATTLTKLSDIATGNCLLSGGVNTAPSWGACTGGSGGGVTSLDSQTGVLSLGNSTGSAGTITINDAKADASTKGIATFNATNFTATTGTINTIQNIATSSTPSFGGLTLSGALSVTSGGASIAGGLNNNSGGITNAGSIAGATTLAQTVTTNTTNSAATSLNVTNSNATATSTTVNGETIALAGHASGTNITNGINFANVTTIGGNVFNGLNFGTGYDAVLNVGGNAIINGTGIIQSAGITGTYGNLTGTGTLTAGVWNATAIGAQYGGTGLNTSASTGVPSISGGTWSVNTQLPASLGGTGIGSYAVGDLLYASGATTLTKLSDIATGNCLLSGGVNTAPSWGACTGGSGGGVTSLDSQTGVLSLGNSTGSAGTITINDAKADASTKGIATFNATNFTATTGTINTIQNIATSSTPSFGGLTLSGALSVTSGGASIAGGLNNNSGGITNAGSIAGATTLAQTVTTNTTNSAATSLNVTNSNATATSTTVNGETIALAGHASGTNITNGINFANVTTIGGNVFNGLNFGTGYDAVLNVGGNAIINGTGIIQSAGITGTYGNLTGTGTLTAGVWNATAIGAQYGGTGLNTSASTGVPSISGGTWSVNTQLPASLGGTGIGSYAVGDLLYASGATTLTKLSDIATGNCLLSGGVNTAPSWGACTGGSGGGVTSLDSQTGVLSLGNSTGSAGTITINDAKADASTKGIATFNATNFTATTGTINTIQNIATSSTPSFGGLTLSGALSVTSGGASIAGGLNNNSGGITNAGSIAGATTLAQTVTTNTTNSAATSLNVTNSNATATSTTVNGETIALAGHASGTNITNGINFANVTTIGGNVFNGLNFGTGYDAVLNVGGNAIINGTGIIQSAGITGTYGNLTGTGTLTAGVWNATAIGAQYGGTGLNTSASTGVPSISGGTWSVNTQLPASLGGTGIGSYAVGDLLYASGATTLTKLSDIATGNCLLSGGVNTAPSWGACTGGSGGGVTSLDSQTGVLSLGNSTGSAGTITINDAKADASTKGIATFNATNFTATTGTINTIQNIATSSTPSFGGLTLSGALSVTSGGASIAGGLNNNSGGITNAGSISGVSTLAASGEISTTADTTGLALTGTPVAGTGITSLLQLGGAIASGNSSTNGGTYLGINEPGAGIGSAADFLNLENAGVAQFKVSSTGNLSATGTYNTNTFNSNTLQFGAAVAATVQSATGQDLDITGSASLNLQAAGTNTLSADTTGAGTVNLGNTNALNINIGTVGAGATARTINIGNNSGTVAGPTTVNIAHTSGSGLGVQNVFIGTTFSGGGTTIAGGAGTAVSLQAATGGTIQIDPLSAGSTSGTVNIGNVAAGANTFVSTIHIADSAGTTAAQSVSIGSTGGASTLLLSGGTGSSAITLQTASGGGIQIGSASGGAVSIQGSTATVVSSNGTNTTTVGFNGTQAAGNITYNFDRTAAPGIYTICTSVGNCTGPSSVTSLDSQTGILTLANSGGSAGTITINNAKADASTKGIATFNATNFLDNGTGTINTVQNIATASTPTFGGLTLSGALGVTVTTNTTNSAATSLNVTNSNATATSTTVNGETIALAGHASGTNITNGINFANVTTIGGNVFNGLNFGTGYDAVLNVGGNAIINGTGIIQSAGITGTYGNLTGTGTLTAGVWNATAIGAQYGGTGLNTSASTGVPSISGGTWSVNTQLPASLGGTGIGSYAVGDLLYASGATTLTKLSDIATGNCLLSGGVNTAPSWGACTGGSGGGVTSLDSQTGVLSLGNSTGSAGTITINDAKADASTKGIATFNATNFTATTGTINTIQNIATSSTPSFGGLTLSGALSVTSGGASIAGGLNNNSGGITNAGSIAGATTLAQTVTTNTTNSAATSLNVTNSNATATSTTVNGETIALAGHASGTNITNGINFANVTTIGGNVFNGLNFGTGYDAVLNVGGNAIINGTGIIQSAGITGTYGNLTGTGTLTAGVWNATAIGAQYGGTGLNTSASTGVPSISGGTWSVNTQLPASLGGTGIGSYAVGDLLYASGATTLTKLSDIATGNCLLSGGVNTAPSWGACTGGSGGGVTSLDSQTGVLSLGNSTGSAGTITINDAKADASTKGIATFNATNFTATTGTINTIQNIATSSTPSFGGLTLSGALSVTSGGASIAGGLNNNSGGITNAGSIAGATTLAQTVTTNTTNSAATSLNVTNSNATATSTTVNGETIALAGHASGTNITNGINFANVTTIGGNVFNGLNFGTGYDAVLNVGGNAIINGTGIIQSAGITGTYGNLTGTGTLTAGVWNATAIGAQYGGTGLNTSASTGVPSISGGTWSVNTQLPASLGGTGIGSYAVGDLLYASGATTLTKLSDIATGNCLLSGGVNTAPSWGACTGGSGGGVTSLDSQTGVLSLGNSTGSAGTITINDAKADASTKGIATFNATNFTATTGTINTIQNIATSSTPSFGGLTLSGALSVTSGGASIAGGLNNNTGGITNVGALSSVSTYSQSSAINTGDIHTISDTSFAPTAGNSGNGQTVSVQQGASNATGNSTVNGYNATATLAVSSGAGAKVLSEYNANAVTLTGCTGGNCTVNGVDVTTQSTGAAATITQNGLNVQAVGISAGNLNGLNISSITAGGGAETAINLGSGWDTLISTPSFTLSGTGAISGATGLSSSGAITFSNLSTAGIVTNTAGGALGTVTAVPTANGGTGLNTSASTGVPSISAGTWSVNAQLPATLGGTGQSSYTTGDLLFASSSTTIGKLNDITAGSCLVSGGAGVAPAWGGCGTGGLIQVPTANTGANSNNVVPGANGIIGLTVNGTTGTSAVAAIFNQANNITPSDTVQINDTSGGTQANDLLITRSGAGTTTNLLNLNNISGTATNGLTFTGSFNTNLINTSSGNFSVTNGGSITGVGVNSGSGLIQGTGGTTLTGATSINASGAANTILGGSSGTIAIGGGSAGVTTLQSSSTIGITGGAAVTIQSGTNTNVILKGGGTGYIQIGTANGGAGGTTPDILVLDAGSGISGGGGDAGNDPSTEVNGAMYYNSDMKSFRCGASGIWASCTGLISSVNAISKPNITATGPVAFQTTSSIPIGYQVPANDCQPGVVYQVTASGLYNQGGLQRGIDFELMDGTNDLGEAVAQGSSLNPSAGAVYPGGAYGVTIPQEEPWQFFGTIICDSTTTAIASGSMTFGIAQTGPTGNSQAIDFTWDAQGVTGQPTPGSWDATAGSSLHLAASFSGGATTGNGIQMDQWDVQRMGP